MDFPDLLDQYGIPYHATGPKCTQGWVNFRCPWCMRDPYMGYCLSGRFVSCWNCGGQNLTATLRLLTGLPLSQAAELVGSLPRVFVERPRHNGKYTEPEGLETLEPNSFHGQYLRGRGLSPISTVSKWGLKGWKNLPYKRRWRIWIPIVLNGEVVSWTSRSIMPDNPLRYLNAEDEDSSLPVSHLLYGIDHARCSIIVVEGPVDVWRIGPGAVALLGTNCTPQRLLQIARFPYRVVCFDNEPDAQLRARNLCKELSLFPGTTKNVVLNSKDPGGCTPEELDKLRRLIL